MKFQIRQYYWFQADDAKWYGVIINAETGKKLYITEDYPTEAMARQQVEHEFRRPIVLA